MIEIPSNASPKKQEKTASSEEIGMGELLVLGKVLERNIPQVDSVLDLSHEDYGKLIKRIFGMAEDYLSEAFHNELTEKYEPPEIELFKKRAFTPQTREVTVPMYHNFKESFRTIYVPHQSLRPLEKDIGLKINIPGLSYILLHEDGHDVQVQLQLRAKSLTDEELFADYIAGMILGMRHRKSPIFEKGDLKTILKIVDIGGDDKASHAGGKDLKHPGTVDIVYKKRKATGKLRREAFLRGLKGGTLRDAIDRYIDYRVFDSKIVPKESILK